MSPFDPDLQPSPSAPAQGVWRPMLRKRLLGRAEPLFIDVRGMRSAASLWSGAQVWAGLLRSYPEATPVVVWQTGRLALLQLLIAALWDGRSLQIEASSRLPWPDALFVDGRQVVHDGQTVCRVGDGGWPDLVGPAGMTPLDMLAFAPAQGDISVRGRTVGHGPLWLALGAPLAQARSGPPDPEVLQSFDLAALVTPHDVLNDALMPLLRGQEVWEREALPKV